MLPYPGNGACEGQVSGRGETWPALSAGVQAYVELQQPNDVSLLSSLLLWKNKLGHASKKTGLRCTRGLSFPTHVKPITLYTAPLI